MSDIEIYQKLNKINLPMKRTRFPYNIEFTKKTIDLVSKNGKIFVEPGPRPKKGGVRIYTL